MGKDQLDCTLSNFDSLLDRAVTLTGNESEFKDGVKSYFNAEGGDSEDESLVKSVVRSSYSKKELKLNRKEALLLKKFYDKQEVKNKVLGVPHFGRAPKKVG